MDPLPKATKRGFGQCNQCHREYHNRKKPKICDGCRNYLGGSHSGSKETSPVSSQSNPSVLVFENDNGRLLSVKLTPSDDRSFVYMSSNEKERICFVKQCLELRGTHSVSDNLETFSCKHLEAQISEPVYAMSFSDCEINNYTADEEIKSLLQSIQIPGQATVVKVSEKNFAILGLPSTTMPMKYTHVHVLKQGNDTTFKCTSNSCKKKVGRTKQAFRLPICIHKHCVILASKIRNTYNASEESPSSSSDQKLSDSRSLSRESTITLQTNRKIPYIIPKNILCQSDKIVFDASHEIPTFEPSFDNCQLCNAPLGKSLLPQGCKGKNGNGIILNNTSPFQPVFIKLKKCLNDQCLALNTIFPIDKGLFNGSNKVLVGIDILLEWRLFFKEGFPITNVITRKLELLELKTDTKLHPTASEKEYLTDTLYNAFYAFEMMTERNPDNVICGICGIAGKVYFGDGNEKNCCSMKEIDLSNIDNDVEVEDNGDDNFTKCFEKIKRKMVEKATYAGVKNDFTIGINEIPIFMSLSMRKHQYNTESQKRSVYLKTGFHESEGDVMLLYDYLKQKKCGADFSSMILEDLKDIALKSGLPTQNKSKSMIVLQLQCLYESLLTGKSYCHQFTKVPGHTGGFYHIVCPHGTTVGSKFMVLTESVRDAADLWLSLKHPPVLFVCDTPCTLARHINLRSPELSVIYWGERNGCFEKPQQGKDPTKGINVEDIVPPEFSSVSQIPLDLNCDTIHPLTGKPNRYICGDRFHNKSNPHKSELCKYHDIDLALQSTTVKTSYQESFNNRKNRKRNRSACSQSFMTHIFFNYLMDFYENEEIVLQQRTRLENIYGKTVHRDQLKRFIV